MIRCSKKNGEKYQTKNRTPRLKCKCAFTLLIVENTGNALSHSNSNNPPPPFFSLFVCLFFFFLNKT